MPRRRNAPFFSVRFSKTISPLGKSEKMTKENFHGRERKQRGETQTFEELHRDLLWIDSLQESFQLTKKGGGKRSLRKSMRQKKKKGRQEMNLLSFFKMIPFNILNRSGNKRGFQWTSL